MCCYIFNHVKFDHFKSGSTGYQSAAVFDPQYQNKIFTGMLIVRTFVSNKHFWVLYIGQKRLKEAARNTSGFLI